MLRIEVISLNKDCHYAVLVDIKHAGIFTLGPYANTFIASNAAFQYMGSGEVKRNEG